MAAMVEEASTASSNLMVPRPSSPARRHHGAAMPAVGQQAPTFAASWGLLSPLWRGCCISENAEARSRLEAPDEAQADSRLYGGELAVPVLRDIFPTILKATTEAKQPPPAPPGAPASQHGMQFGRGADSTESGRAASSSPGRGRGGMQWAPGGVLASLMGGAVGSEVEDLVECPEREIEGGSRYTGQWLGDERHGRGLLLTHDGLRYEGQLRHNMAHGRGTFVEADGSKYEGQWNMDTKHGHGIYSHSDGTTYEGQWRKDVKWGTGTEAWADGALYQGEFRDGFKHGVGIYRGNNGVEFEGQFHTDRMHGEGCYRFVGGRKYFGQWVDGHMDGCGRMEWPNGSVYEGGYERDTKSGEGVFLWPDGRRFTGQWLKGKQHGQGITVDPQGLSTMDTWHHGELLSSEELPSEDQERWRHS